MAVAISSMQAFLGDYVMAVWKRIVVLCLCVFVISCTREAVQQSSADGVYATPAETRGYFAEVLELRDGCFKYWAQADVSGGPSVEYPVTGTYELVSDEVQFQGAQHGPAKRTRTVIGGRTLLLRDDALAHWRSSRQVYPYGCLVRMPELSTVTPFLEFPSVSVLGTNVDVIPLTKDLPSSLLPDAGASQADEGEAVGQASVF